MLTFLKKANSIYCGLLFYPKVLSHLVFLSGLGLGEWATTQARLMQIDTGMTNLVWGIDETEKAFIMSDENALRLVSPSAITSIRHVTAGGAGVWAIDDSGRIFFRLGTSDYNRRGKLTL